jgi:hypothetical protein
MSARIPRDPQRGSAMLVTMVVITSLLAGAVVLVAMQLASGRSTDLTRTGLSAMYCAEAGLTASRATVAGNYDQWSTSLTSTTQPAWLSNTAFSHDLDGDGVDDFAITIKDNDDETAPTPNDLAIDTDLKIFIVSTCIKFPDTPKQVSELIEYKPAANCYGSQEGGCNGRGNQNKAP